MTGCRHLLYASSSSVYGANTRVPFRTSDNVDHPLSLYGATKKANELMAHAYAHLFALPATGLRFFTVYGPWGRPDMAIGFSPRRSWRGRPIRLFNGGRYAARFHLCRRRDRSGGAPARPPARAQPGLVARCSRPGDQLRAVARLQHRQQRAGRADRGGAIDRAGDRQVSGARAPADAAGRRCGRPVRTLPIWSAPSGSDPGPRSSMGFTAMSIGTAAIRHAARRDLAPSATATTRASLGVGSIDPRRIIIHSRGLRPRRAIASMSASVRDSLA